MMRRFPSSSTITKSSRSGLPITFLLFTLCILLASIYRLKAFQDLFFTAAVDDNSNVFSRFKDENQTEYNGNNDKNDNSPQHTVILTMDCSKYSEWQSVIAIGSLNHIARQYFPNEKKFILDMVQVTLL